MFRPTALFLAASLLGNVPAYAEELYRQGDFEVRWDNTLRYSVGARLENPSPTILAHPDSDDGDRAFTRGLMTNRLDLLSVLDLTKSDFGVQVSIAAWYDTVYHESNADRAPTANAVSVPAGTYTRATRNIDGQYAEFSDSFAYANFALAGMPLSLRIGRQTLLWGESLFFGQDSIAAAQAPVDYVKSTTTPESYAKSVFLPVNQVSFTLQPDEEFSVAGYYQLEWRGDRLPGVGSYFSVTDLQGAGAERAFAQGVGDLLHIPDRNPSGDGQFGVSLHARLDEMDLGLYALRYDSKDPILTVLGNRGGSPTEFQSIYPTGVDLYGGSFSGYLGDSNIAGEISVRLNTPLVSRSPVSLYLLSPIVNTVSPGYAEGNTFHGQVSIVNTLGPSSFWDSADLSTELAANDLLAVTSARAALQPGRTGWAASARGQFQPHYFEALPNLDISLLLSLGLNFAGDSSVNYSQNSGTGDFEVGISATYLSVWKVDLTFTSFLGPPLHQPLTDRTFLLLGLERSI
jgi:hypothetical protein